MWRAQRRRSIPEVWSCAAVRLQRCPGVRLTVKNTSTDRIPRARGAFTGNSLAPWFGKLVVEDAFMAVQQQIDTLCYNFLSATLRPMAWSDNIVAFANSSSRVARLLSIIAQQLERMHLHIKEGSLEIVPASTRRLQWATIREGPYTFTVTDETKLLGYYVACNGDTSRSRATLLGALRGRLSSMDKRFSLASTAARARWWKQQYCGFVGFGCCISWNKLYNSAPDGHHLQFWRQAGVQTTQELQFARYVDADQTGIQN